MVGYCSGRQLDSHFNFFNQHSFYYKLYKLLLKVSKHDKKVKMFNMASGEYGAALFTIYIEFSLTMAKAS
jgi:hypothetical protein